MNLKKPKFWNFKNPNFFSYLLYPISLIIILINSLKDRSNKKKFKIKTVCIGNIYLGGTGKTSLSIKLNKILCEKNFKSCFIKKFYKNQIDEQKLLKNNGKLFMASKRIDLPAPVCPVMVVNPARSSRSRWSMIAILRIFMLFIIGNTSAGGSD